MARARSCAAERRSAGVGIHRSPHSMTSRSAYLSAAIAQNSQLSDMKVLRLMQRKLDCLRRRARSRYLRVSNGWATRRVPSRSPPARSIVATTSGRSPPPRTPSSRRPTGSTRHGPSCRTRSSTFPTHPPRCPEPRCPGPASSACWKDRCAAMAANRPEDALRDFAPNLCLPVGGLGICGGDARRHGVSRLDVAGWRAAIGQRGRLG
jgi:hypothetical protein